MPEHDDAAAEAARPVEPGGKHHVIKAACETQRSQGLAIQSGPMFCYSTCEPKAFVQITYLPRPPGCDRVPAITTTVIRPSVADISGTAVQRQSIASGEHAGVVTGSYLRRPFPKPCLSVRAGGRCTYVLYSRTRLHQTNEAAAILTWRIYVEPENSRAMCACDGRLKRSMLWDEKRSLCREYEPGYLQNRRGERFQIWRAMEEQGP